ncbi:MAG: type II secretion system GspH family protein [Gammaproteobacteria bacterium]|nr:type II secretion system GspH family protein [Gammaproteobacteria bacterium]
MSRSQRGFSLLEMIAVLAIASILAGALAPSLVRGIKKSYASAEEQSLRTLSSSLKEYVLERKRIPSSTLSDWSGKLAEISSEAPGKISQNERGFTRILVFDPTFLSSTPAVFPGLTQSLGLTNQPHSPRAMFVSDLTRNLTGTNVSSSQFDAIWAQASGALYTESDDLKIERVNFAPLFHRVLLTNQNTTESGYSLESGPIAPVPAKSGTLDGSVERFIISETKLDLFEDPFSSASLQTSDLVNGSTTYRYEFNGTSWNWTRP